MGLDTFLKRYFPGVILALVALAAYFQAAGLTQLVGSTMATAASASAGARPLARPPRAASSAAEDDHATSARAILDRNPFDSVTPRPLDAIPVELDAGEAVVIDLEHSQNAPLCDGVKVLIVVSSPSDPGWSMAALQASGQPQTKLVRIGEEVGGKTLQLVEWNRVVLSSGSSICQVQMFRSEKA